MFFSKIIRKLETLKFIYQSLFSETTELFLSTAAENFSDFCSHSIVWCKKIILIVQICLAWQWMVSFTAENLVKLLILFYFSQNKTKKNFFAFFVSEIANFKCIFRCIFCCFIEHKSMHICSFLVHENPGPRNYQLWM